MNSSTVWKPDVNQYDVRAQALAGWRAYLDDDGAAVMFCLECRAREFGD